MYLKVMTAIALLSSVAVLPAKANMECTASEISRLETAIDKLTDATAKSVAKQQMILAKQMMASNDLKACSMYLKFSDQTVFNRG